MQTIYRPGQWNLIVMPGALVALPSDVPGVVVARLWEQMPNATTLGTVVDALVSYAGGSFTSLPPFVAMIAEGTDVRIALRGGVSAVVTTATDTIELSGDQVTTWNERFFDDARSLEIVVSATDDAAHFPVQSGIVRAASVSVALERTATEPERAVAAPIAPEPAPAPATAPEPAPERAPATPPIIEDTLLPPGEVTLAPSADDDFDQLWGETVHSAGAAAGAAAVAPVVQPLVEGDHDGATVSAAELRALRQQPPPADDAPTAVLDMSETAVAPSVGRIHVSTGQVTALDRTVIIGRRPRSTRASGANLPHLIAVESPQQDISRSHLEIRPEGDTVVVLDLHTTNGSTLLRPGADPMRLHPGEQTLVLSGDIVDLGDGVTVVFEDLP